MGLDWPHPGTRIVADLRDRNTEGPAPHFSPYSFRVLDILWNSVRMVFSDNAYCQFPDLRQRAELSGRTPIVDICQTIRTPNPRAGSLQMRRDQPSDPEKILGVQIGPHPLWRISVIYITR